ncbi:zinc finger, CCHC-type containing protein [Tanacetum coccineum]
MKVDGTIDKFKARSVIQGFRQKEGIDNFDTYAPVARITTIRLLLALAAIHNLVIHKMDVKTTFLNGDLDEEVYMKQPKCFVMPGNEHKVLVKSLYGLKQAPKQWHQKFAEVVLSSGFLLNQSDKCVYSKFDDSSKGVIICLYVDDMLIYGTDQNQVDKTKKFLSSRFSMKDMGEANVILGIKIKHEYKGIIITQSHYIEKILKKFNREDCSPLSTPMDLVEKLKPNTGKPVDQLEYSRAIGCLMYAMTSTRPDIPYAAGRLSRYPSVLKGYSDASWINHVKDSSSMSGWVFILGGALAASVLPRWLKHIVKYIMESRVIGVWLVGKIAMDLRYAWIKLRSRLKGFRFGSEEPCLKQVLNPKYDVSTPIGYAVSAALTSLLTSLDVRQQKQGYEIKTRENSSNILVKKEELAPCGIRNLVGFVVDFQKLLVVVEIVVEIEKKLLVVVVEKLVARVTLDLLIIMASKCLIIVSGCLAFCLVLGLVGVLPIYLTSLDPYSLGKDDLVYKHHLKTEQYGIDFYVKSGFDKKYPVGTRARAELEKRVINEYIEDNQRYCHRELSQRWYYGDINYPIPDCDDLKSKNITITPFFP